VEILIQDGNIVMLPLPRRSGLAAGRMAYVRGELKKLRSGRLGSNKEGREGG
jgi:hypothetical protein